MPRPPKPDALKQLQGTARPDRMNFDQPEYDLVIEADPPEYLTATAKRIWHQIVPDFIRSKIYKTIDEGMVAMLCEELAAYWVLQGMATVNKVATVVNGKINYNKDAYQLCMLKQMHFNNATKLMIQFGMSPVSRQALKINPMDGISPKLKDALPAKPAAAYDSH